MRGIAISACILAVTSTGCGRPAESQSNLQYRLAGPSSAGLTWKVANPTIKVCYDDPNNNQAQKDDVTDGIMLWVDALRDVANIELARDIQLVALGQACDMEVRIGPYSPAQTQMGAKPKVYINHTGWYGSQTVTLHELGHAFGLLDTYEGRGGSCQPGQPDSVMCQARYPDLLEDDVLGLQAMYARVRNSRGVMTSDANEGRVVF